MGRTLSGELDSSGKAAALATGNAPPRVRRPSGARTPVGKDERGWCARGACGDRGLEGGGGGQGGHPPTGGAKAPGCPLRRPWRAGRREWLSARRGRKRARRGLFVSPVTGQLHSPHPSPPRDVINSALKCSIDRGWSSASP